MSAIQNLRLCPQGHLHPWLATLKAIQNIRQLIHNGIPSRTTYSEPDINVDKDLYLRRRIFTKVGTLAFYR